MPSELASNGNARPPLHPRLLLQGVLRQPQLRPVHPEAASPDQAVLGVRAVVSLRRTLRGGDGGTTERVSPNLVRRKLPQQTEIPKDLRRLQELYDKAEVDRRSEMFVDADGHVPQPRAASDKTSPGDDGEHGTVAADVTQLPRHPPDARPAGRRSFAAAVRLQRSRSVLGEGQ